MWRVTSRYGIAVGRSYVGLGDGAYLTIGSSWSFALLIGDLAS
jgi:hypothetical protein